MRFSTFLTLALSSLAAAQIKTALPVDTAITFITLTTRPTINPTILPTLIPTATLTLTTKPTATPTTCTSTYTLFQTSTVIQATVTTRTATILTTSTVTSTATVKPTSNPDPTPGVHYQNCSYPGWPLSVINFEYQPKGTDISDYRGLKWVNWAGFNYYPGYPDGWAPIPSNYTTGFTKTGGKETDLYIAPGPRATLTGVHSFWFYYYEVGVKKDATNIIYVEGLSGGTVVYAEKIYTYTVQDGVWEHVCLDWQGIDTIRFVLPDCSYNGCGGAWFEVDDIWARGKGR